MGKMTAEELKDALIKGITFTEPIIVTDTLNFDRECDKRIKYLPNNLLVDRIVFSKSEIILLPDNLYAYEISLGYSQIILLPNNLHVHKLYLNYSKITLLPNNLFVNVLNLSDSQITVLPDNLSVEYLSLYNSKINNIPPTIKNTKIIYIDEYFLFSISYESFLTCLLLFKNIIKFHCMVRESNVLLQFERRFLIGK